MRWLRKLWYLFLGAPRVFVMARDVGHDLSWYVYSDGEWMGPFTLTQADSVAKMLEDEK